MYHFLSLIRQTPRGLLIACALVGLTAAAAPMASVAQAPCPDCDGKNPSYRHASANARTQYRFSLEGRSIELRVNDKLEVAWTRIMANREGDRIWLDRSYDGGVHWTQYGPTPIGTGSGDFNYTHLYNNHRNLVRACGDVLVKGKRKHGCTNWY